MASEKLTKAVLDRLAPGAKIWDTQVRGLIADRGARGVAFRVQADLWQHGRLVRTFKSTLGRFGTGPGQLTIDQARAAAQTVLGDVHAGRDPDKPQRDASDVWTLADALEAYGTDAIKERGAGAQRTVDDMKARAERHLADWMDRRLDTITPLEARQRHEQIRDAVKVRAREAFEQREAEIRAGAKVKPRRPPTDASGAKTANAVLGDVRALFGLAMKVFPTTLTINPVNAVRFSRERKAHQFLQLDEFPTWAVAVNGLKNPIRKALHWTALLSGLRPTNVMNMRVEWVDLPGRAVHFPASEMKARRAFDLPLSAPCAAHIQAALEAARVLHSGSPFVFPSRDADGRIIATAVVKEKTMPSHYVGHSLRHSMSNVCELIGIDGDTRQMLLAQKVAGVRGVYLSPDALFGRLLEASERVTAKILELTGAALPEAKASLP